MDFDLIDLETAGLRRSGRHRKPTWKLADPINKKLKTALGLLSFVVLRASMAHTYAYSALDTTMIHKAISIHARMRQCGRRIERILLLLCRKRLRVIVVGVLEASVEEYHR